MCFNKNLYLDIRHINTYNSFQNQKSTKAAFYIENTTDNVANFCF
jgi:hypothetical protein